MLASAQCEEANRDQMDSVNFVRLVLHIDMVYKKII